MKLVAYLNFDGQCAAAFKFYEQCLGGRIVSLMTHGESPMAGQVPPSWKDRVIHAHLDVAGQSLFGSDSPPEHHEPPKGFSVAVTVDDPDEAERVFHALSHGGSVRMPIQKTFWAARFGMLVDQFGVPWMVSSERP